MTAAIPIYEAKNKLTFYIHQAEKEGPVKLSRHNKDVAVIVSNDDYGKLLALANSTAKRKSFLERAQDFRERNADFYSDSEIDGIFGNLKDNSGEAFINENSLFDGVLEDADE